MRTPSPLLPRHPKNPVGQSEKIARASKAIRGDILRLQKQLIKEWEALPVRVQNAGLHNQFYEYLIDLSLLRRIVSDVRSGLSDGNGARQAVRQTEAAYVNGTGMAVENLSRLTDDYTRQVTMHLGSDVVQRRAALAGARVFEQMEGFAGNAATDLGRVLFSAVQSGENPRETAKRIRGRFGVARSRAEMIARTEITGALRRGRWDEARDAQDKFGIETRLIHYSALIPGRTRDTHAERHGKVVTIEEQAEWYEQDGNGINCLCSATETIVDSEGVPIMGEQLRERMAGAKSRFEADEAEDGDALADDPGTDATTGDERDAKRAFEIEDYNVVGREGGFTYAENRIPAYTEHDTSGVMEGYKHDQGVAARIREMAIENEIVFGEREIQLSDLTSFQSTVRLENLKSILENFDLGQFVGADPATVFILPDGQFVLKDGNHRINAALANRVRSANFQTIQFKPRSGRMPGYDAM